MAPIREGIAIEPDAQLRPRQAERRGGFDHGGLQPIDADRLLVADVVLEADVDEIAGFDHLLGRLREPRLVAVDRRNVEEAGQEKHHAAQHQEHDRAKMAGRGEVERGEPACGWNSQVLQAVGLLQSAGVAKVSTILFAYDETALQTTPQFPLSGWSPGPIG